MAIGPAGRLAGEGEEEEEEGVSASSGVCPASVRGNRGLANLNYTRRCSAAGPRFEVERRGWRTGCSFFGAAVVSISVIVLFAGAPFIASAAASSASGASRFPADAASSTLPSVLRRLARPGHRPGASAFISSALGDAQAAGANHFVLVLNTFGGDGQSMDDIVQAISAYESSGGTFITLVAPYGAHAFSAGAYIAEASDEIYMVNGSVIGSATPIVSGIPTGEENTTMTKDIDGFTAYMQALASQFGRNSTAAGLMVTNGVSFVAEAAYRDHVVDGLINAYLGLGRPDPDRGTQRHTGPDPRGELAAAQHPQRPEPVQRPFPGRGAGHPGRPLPPDLRAVRGGRGLDSPLPDRVRLLRRPALRGPADVHRGCFHLPRGEDAPRHRAVGGIVVFVVGFLLVFQTPAPPATISPGAVPPGNFVAPDAITYAILALIGGTIVVASIFLFRVRRDLERRKSHGGFDRTSLIGKEGFLTSDLAAGKVATATSARKTGRSGPADLPKGARVKVRAIEGFKLVVEGV